MKLKSLINKAVEFGKKNAPAIWTGVSAAGVVLTVFATAKAAIRVHEILKAYKEDAKEIKDKEGDSTKLLKERQKRVIVDVTKTVVPAALSLIGTEISIFSANAAARKEIKGLSAVLALTQTSLDGTRERLTSLKETLKESLPDKKMHDIENKDLEKRAQKIDLPAGLCPGPGDVPTVDMYHDPRFIFYTNQVAVEKAIAALSMDCMNESYVSVWDFYEKLGVKNIPSSLQDIGWDSDCIVSGSLPITVTTFLHPSGIPCLAIDYEPQENFRNGGGRFRN